MADPTKFAGRSAVLKREAPTDTWTDVGQVQNIGPVGSSRGLIDASTHGDDWKDYVLDQQDGDEVQLDIVLDPENSQHDAIVADYDAATQRNYRVTQTESGLDLVFPALITKLSRQPERAGLLKMSITVKILNPGVEDFDAS